jgi:hypothetical protein
MDFSGFTGGIIHIGVITKRNRLNQKEVGEIINKK